ncbi:quinon protein alcohol dehydrogenase-like superfamily [Rhizoctonia solani]|nr:quinon protein alcohol dehydrogenase-like superfamily [Rhizoctonia solani]
MFSQLDRLPSGLLAWYNPAEGLQIKHRACTPGTRVDALANVLGWARDGAGGGVYWLNGMASTGKTTIAYSACAELAGGHQLAASFFCSRLREERKNVNLTISSIAYQLARFSRPFQSALCAVLRKDPDIDRKLPHLQLDELIVKPIFEVQGTLPEGLVVVIDGLDECEHKESIGQMLDVLLGRSVSLPIKFIVSSRSEPDIRDQMTEDRLKARLVLHDLDRAQVQADIETYLRAELTPMRQTQTQITGLVERAGILFIYAATAVRYISHSNFRHNPSARLRTILNGPQGSGTGDSKDIDQLYTMILQAAFGDKGLEEADRAEMQQVLNTVICAREPLTTTGLTELLKIDCIERVRDALRPLRPLWSVVHVVEATELVTTLHASFPDFMFGSTRSKAYHCDSESHNHRLAEHCFDFTRRTQPQFNICGIQPSYLSDDDVISIEAWKNAISSELLYACRHWADHVKAGARALDVVGLLREFLSMRLLLWVEVLNLRKQMKAGMECMKLAVEWCNQYEADQELIELAVDAQRFVDTFVSNLISQSTPHIYGSMLPFWPEFGPISQCYARTSQGPAKAEETALNRRQLAHLSTWAFDKGIDTVTVSPNGLWVALVLNFHLLVIDSSSGQIVLGLLKRYKDNIDFIGFSPDGSCILAASRDDERAIKVGWDTRTGNAALGPIQLDGHTGSIYCLELSPDCTLAAMSSFDKTIRLWSTMNGTMLRCLETQDMSYIVAFSSDSSQIAAGYEGTLQVWDCRTGTTTLGPLTNDPTYTIAFCPNAPQLADATDHAIYVRDIQNGDAVHILIHGHTDYIGRIAYSLDDRYLVSGSGDRTLRIWDAQNGKLELGPLTGHTGDIRSIAFMPDSSRIISADDDGRVCIWDIRQSNCSPSSINTLTSRITSAKFTSDGAHFVTGSEDGVISIWDSHTGDVTAGPIQAHEGPITVVDILNDRVAAGFWAGAICVRNALSGEVVLGPVDVHPGKEIDGIAIAYSPDGHLIATGFDEEVSLWDAQNNSKVLDLLHAGEDIISVQFSPDSSRLVVGSWEVSTVWDVSDGRNLFGEPHRVHRWCWISFILAKRHSYCVRL